MNNYTVLEGDKGPIPNIMDGFYREMLVNNQTNQSIILVTRDDKRILIPPQNISPSFNRYVDITVREKNGERRASNNNCAIPIPSKSIQIPVSKLKGGPVFVDEIDMMVCFEDHASFVAHPGSGVSFEAAMDQLMSSLANNVITPNVKVYGNDPNGKINKIWLHLAGSTFPIHLTSFPSSEPGIHIITMVGKKVVKQTLLELGDIEECGGKLTFHSGDVFFVGITKSQVELAMLQNREKDFDEGDIEAIVKHGRAELQTMLDEKERELSILKEKHKLEIVSKNNKLEELELEVRKLKIQVDEWRAIAETRGQNEERNAKNERAKHAVEAERIKYYGTIWKIVGGVGIAGATWIATRLYEKYFNQ